MHRPVVTTTRQRLGERGEEPQPSAWVTRPSMGGTFPVASALLLCAALLAGCGGGDPSTAASESAAVDSAAPEISVSPVSPGPGANLDAPDQNGASESAADAVTQLPVKGRSSQSQYDRDLFGDGWLDPDGNGCDARNDALQAELTAIELADTCRVLSGTLADPYTGRSIRFVYGGVSEVDVDHVVALSDAWQKGASTWSEPTRIAFANDPLNLQPTDAPTNRQKGDGDAATWLPPNKSYRCDYVARQAAVKQKYELAVTAAEQQAMLRVLSDCPGHPLPNPG